jgi:hypothetical protein
MYISIRPINTTATVAGKRMLQSSDVTINFYATSFAASSTTDNNSTDGSGSGSDAASLKVLFL